MLIFLKSARRLHKNAHFFPIFLIEYYIFQIFSYIFQQQNGRVRSRAISALAGWLPLLLDDNVDDAILERVWTGCSGRIAWLMRWNETDTYWLGFGVEFVAAWTF